ncbi:MAG TPA: S8 family serine peptidase, partial [Actinomycetota bacterium]|nr:S8 family serine peptidase [Actinomycetota bacterium]
MKRMKVAILLLVALVAAPQFAYVSNAAPVKEHRAGVSTNLTPLLKDDKALIPVIIQFTSAPTVADKEMLLKAGFLEPMVRYSIIPALQAVAPAASIKSIFDEKRVRYVEHDRVIPWALDRATQVSRASDVWGAEYQADGQTLDTGFTGRGIGVAVVDSGVDATHPDLLHHTIANRLGLPAKTVANLKLVGRDSVGLYGAIIPVGNVVGPFLEANALGVDMPDTDTTGGHGTHVAGITSGNGTASEGKYKGAAPGANLIGFGAGEALLVSSGLAAFDWIHNSYEDGNPYNIRVVNNSWGGAGDWDEDSAVTKAARRLVNDDGIAVVFAAGNDGGNGLAIETSVWANIPEMISVGNYYDRYGWVTGSSSRGMRSLQRTWPHVSAPGTQIISTAAQGKPVTYVCTGQDALIDEEIVASSESPDSEPTVVPAPLPTAQETDLVDDEKEVIGNYASCTGTSMAAPHVAGVVALILEANPDLTPLVVRQILMETANMPVGRNYDVDGYAIGRGVVDAAEAVAVALKMREGLSLQDALRLAYVNYGNSSNLEDAELNQAVPRNLEITSPADGTELGGSTVTVAGDFNANAGRITDDSIPFAPFVPRQPITGDAQIYQLGLLDPFVAPRRVPHTLVGGSSVNLQIRSISWNETLTVPPGAYPAEHRIYRADGSTFANLTTNIRLSGTEWSTASTQWNVPVNAPAGDYVFEGAAFAGGARYVMDRLPFRIATAGSSSVPAGSSFSSSSNDFSTPTTELPFPLNVMKDTNSNTSFYSTDFEGGDAGWTVRQDSTSAVGQQTSWTFVDSSDAQLVWAYDEEDDSDKYWYAGFRHASRDVNCCLPYTPGADVSILSPEVDLTSAGTANLTYRRVGFSDAPGDQLRVFAAPSGTQAWQLVDSISGNHDEWAQATASLNSFAGKKIQLRFQFITDNSTPIFPNPLLESFLRGWYVDDIAVVGQDDGGGSVVPVIEPALSASPDEGMSPLTTTLSWNVAANAPITRVELDFGDGSDPYVTTATAGTASHTYEAGYWTPKVTAFVGTHSATASTSVDSIPANTIQVRIDGKPWVSAGTALNSDRDWSAVLDLTGLPEGDHTIQARHCDVDARCIYDSVGVVKIEPPVLFAPSQVSVNEGAGSVTLTASLREASGSTVTATFTTVDGTAKSSSD